MTPKIIEKHKKKIDGMTQWELDFLYNRSPSGHCHKYFDKKLPLYKHFLRKLVEKTLG